MIAKAIKGKGFRGAVAYDLQKGKSVLLDSNMSAKEKGSVSAFAKEFGAIRALRPNLTKAVCHVSISLHPDEHLSDSDWCKAAHTWLKDMGFTDNQYLISRHTDTKHPHIHILVNRIRLDGSATPCKSLCLFGNLRQNCRKTALKSNSIRQALAP